jgi:N-acetylglucosaminyldiphosphoundecaprenol N-acetyl-beta-D-mannosaminyltransferase
MRDNEGMARSGVRPVSQQQPFTDILGVRISALNMQLAVDTIERWIRERDKQYVCICTVHTIMECQRSEQLKQTVNAAGLRTPDGMPLVWLSRRAGHDHVSRVYGPDLMLELCKRSGTSGHRHFFYGGGPGVVETLVDRLTSEYPDLDVAGVHTPGMLASGELENRETIEKINQSGADIVWVGLGAPKQDWWVANHRALLDAPVLIAVGAAFDFHSGAIKQAPAWMQRNGLEWLFRLTQDPKRLWRRYLLDNSRFVIRLAYSSVRSRVPL